MKVLFIGGTGVISSACSELALQQGIELHLLNRGNGTTPVGAHLHVADMNNHDQVKKAIHNLTFDVVVEWVGFTADQVKFDIELFQGKTKQYIFISSASAYQKPPERFPITESTPLNNPFWKYSQDKINCERVLMEAFEKAQFPVTIVRPSHTYNKKFIPVPGRYTVVDRMKKGKKVIVHGDGTSLWTLTHSKDFATGFNGLLGLPDAVGEDFHITSDQWLSWNRIFHLIAKAAGLEPDFIRIPSEFIARHAPDFGAGLMGDKAYSAIFDNSKIKLFVPDFNPKIPFEQGVIESMAWHNEDPTRCTVSKTLSDAMDTVVAAYLAKN